MSFIKRNDADVHMCTTSPLKFLTFCMALCVRHIESYAAESHFFIGFDMVSPAILREKSQRVIFTSLNVAI